ncbi:MAG TPA: EAL domain-containing protein [Beijerinckiaceae bacterium]
MRGDAPSLPARAASWRAVALVWVGIGLTAAGLAGFGAYTTLTGRERALATAGATAQNLARVLENHTQRSVDAVELLLRLVAASGEHREAALPGPDRFDPVLAEVLRERGYVAATSVLCAETGRRVFGHGPPRQIAGDLDLDAFRAHRKAGASVRVGKPFFDADTGHWSAAVSRVYPRSASKGAPLLAVAHVDLSQLQRFYASIDVGRGGSIVLWRADGLLLTRAPYNGAHIGRVYPGAALFKELARAPNGLYRAASATDGTRRIVAYRQLPGTDLVTVAALSEEDSLTAWAAEMRSTLAILALVLLALVAFGALVAREMRRRAEAEARATQKSALLEATLETMDQGLLMVDQETTVQVCNRRAQELLELPAELLARRPSFDEVIRYQFARDEFAKQDTSFRDWVESGGFEQTHHVYERERPNGTVLEVRTVPFAGGGAVRTYTDITARKRAEKRISHIARHDALTDLPNRVFFRERLEQALAGMRRRGDGVALLCLDLDHFKGVNDTLGHPIGDALLKAVAQRIRAELREEDTVARLGGDEFAILQNGTGQPAAGAALAHRLVASLGQPYLLEGHPINVGASIGIAVVTEAAGDADTLLRNADLALYRAKEDGRGTYRFFEPAMDAAVQARRSLELDLREALVRGEFVLHYQPFVDLLRGEVVGFEALVRWNHPTRGLISPAEFVPVAEETRLIVPLGDWILRQACQDAVGWPDGIRVAVNISAAQFRGEGLGAGVLSALAQAGLAPERLELEITETVLMQNTEASLKALHRLRGAGVRIAMDDFGTGYSSLSYLRSFPFDKIKIDRSFVRELTHNAECRAIVRAITSLGQSLSISTIAEGVETREQLDAVRAEGCTEVQGYLFSPPVPIEEARRLAPRRRARAA